MARFCGVCVAVLAARLVSSFAGAPEGTSAADMGESQDLRENNGAVPACARGHAGACLADHGGQSALDSDSMLQKNLKDTIGEDEKVCSETCVERVVRTFEHLKGKNKSDGEAYFEAVSRKELDSWRNQPDTQCESGCKMPVCHKACVGRVIRTFHSVMKKTPTLSREDAIIDVLDRKGLPTWRGNSKCVPFCEMPFCSGECLKRMSDTTVHLMTVRGGGQDDAQNEASRRSLLDVWRTNSDCVPGCRVPKCADTCLNRMRNTYDHLTDFRDLDPEAAKIEVVTRMQFQAWQAENECVPGCAIPQDVYDKVGEVGHTTAV